MSGDVALCNLDERVVAQFFHVLLSRFFGSFHRRRASDGVLHFDAFKGKHGREFLIVEANDLKPVLQPYRLGYLTYFERRGCGGDVFLEFTWLERAQLAVLSARGPAPR